VKVLVTGGAGFIGSHVVDALIRQDHDVIVVDNFATGRRDNLNHSARLFEVDIRDEKKLAEIFERERPEAVNHHAAQIDVSKSVKDPSFDAQVNIIGSLSLLENCARYGVRKVIYASSGGAICGNIENVPADEKHPVNPISPYGVSKYTVEHYLHTYNIIHGIDYVVLRYPNVYGPRQSPSGEAGVVAVFAMQMLRGERITIFGSGDKTRDYTHVFDITNANLLSIRSDSTGIYNIGTGAKITDQEVFDTLAKVLGYSDDPIYTDVRPGEIYHSYLDSAKACRDLGWKPRFGFKEGIIQAADYYKSLVGTFE